MKETEPMKETEMNEARVLVVCRWPNEPEPKGEGPGGLRLNRRLPDHRDVEVTIDGRLVTNVGAIRFESNPNEVTRLWVEFLGAEVVIEHQADAVIRTPAPVLIVGTPDPGVESLDAAEAKRRGYPDFGGPPLVFVPLKSPDAEVEPESR